MNTKKLKQLVLDLAIHGKLVPQDPNDEPASELLKRIQAEKAKSAKGKKCKIVEEDTIPFEIPIGWTWCTMDEIAFVTKLAGFEYTKYIVDNLSNISGVPLFKGKNVQDGHIVYEFESYIPENISDELCRSQITRKCLLTPYVGTIGNIGIHDRNGKYHLGSNVGKIEVYNGETTFIKEEYLWYFLRSSSGYSELTKNKKATAQESISIDAIREVYIPLPPLAEQHRIVAAIEKWFAVIDQLEKNEADLMKSIEQTKKKVLDLAIRGKLVAQNPEDEPAGELLARIRADVETHGRASNKAKGKKSSIPSVDLDEVPFEVPEGWCWTLLPNLCSIPITDGTHQTPTYSDKDNGIPFLSSKDVTSRRINWTNIKYITKDLHEELYKRIAPQKDDILLAKNGTTGVAAIVEDDRVFDIYVTLAVIRPIPEVVFPLYLLHIINSGLCKEQFNSHLTGIGLPNLHLTDIKKTIIPLPPLAEQKRIVEKIEEVMGVLERIEGMM